MHTFTFTDNRPTHRHIITLDAAQVATHLAKDQQFMFYWRKGWDPRQQAIRSLHLYPPSEKAMIFPQISAEQWVDIDAMLKTNHA